MLKKIKYNEEYRKLLIWAVSASVIAIAALAVATDRLIASINTEVCDDGIASIDEDTLKDSE